MKIESVNSEEKKEPLIEINFQREGNYFKDLQEYINQTQTPGKVSNTPETQVNTLQKYLIPKNESSYLLIETDSD
mgnify:CR=1 FL=1